MRTLLILFTTGLLALAGGVQAQNPPPLEGVFEGPLVLGRDNMNLAFTFTLREGTLQAAIVSTGLGIFGMPVESVTLDGLRLILRLPQLDAEYTGTLRLNAAGDEVVRIDGDWFQSAEMVPVVLLPVDAPTY